jgi:phage tail sheath protein FI
MCQKESIGDTSKTKGDLPMPVTPPISYPGVYIQELASGVRTIVGVPTSVTAFLGRAPRGPINEPVTVTSFGDYERTFDGLDLNSTMSYAVRDFFLNGGGQAIIVRLFRTGSNPETRARATVGVGNDAWQVWAANPGTWANGLRIKVTFVKDEGMGRQVLDRYGCQAGELFSLSIHDGDPDQKPALENIVNVTIKDGHRRVDQVLGQESMLIGIEKPGQALPNDGDVFTLAGGEDSAGLDASAYLGSEENKTGLYALEKADLFNLLCIPPDKREGDIDKDIFDNVLAYCHRRRAMFIVDPPIAWAAQKETAAVEAKKGVSDLGISGENARNAILYFPRVVQKDPLCGDKLDVFPACGIIAGIIARTDSTRGVWKAPAGLDATLNGIHGLQANLTDAENGLLNPLGINCLRFFPNIGSVLWGARTMRGADQLADDYKYVPVRRLALYIEETLYRSTQWAVFEPNDEPLWSQLRLNIGTFMHDLFRQGAFQGQKPSDAYFVQCDSTTTTQSDINKGIVNILVGFAPLKPAEFVVIYLQQMAGNLAA